MTPPDRTRDIFCNRTLNLRSIKVIGYDMDYTLVHYHVDAWEGRAYEHLRQKLQERGWPVEDLTFDPQLAVRGLVLDLELGNVLKINRFGYIKRATHGTQLMDYRAMRRAYSRITVELSSPRYVFLNTFFSISEACMYCQLVDKLDAGALPDPLTYAALYHAVRMALDAAHVEGLLKAEIMGNPERYVDLDPQTPLALLDQREAGKRLVLITNSEWEYTEFMMRYAFDPFLPEEMRWRDLFELVVVAARKPVFFSESNPMLEVLPDTGLLRAFVGPLREGCVYFGGNAQQIERSMGVSGDHILYVGDHIFTDVNISKNLLRWRTALVLRELEDELEAIARTHTLHEQIRERMHAKEQMEAEYSRLRLEQQRIVRGYGPRSDEDPELLREQMTELREELIALDNEIAPLVIEDSKMFNPMWGYLLRTGNDKSHLTRQLERYADIYMSRVSNMLAYTPFMYFRAPRGTLPHDC